MNTSSVLRRSLPLLQQRSSSAAVGRTRFLSLTAAARQGSGEASAAEIGRNTTGKTKVLYDGDCPLCVQEIKVLSYLDKKKDVIELVDISKPGYDQTKHNNIPLDEAMGIMHVISPDNTVHKRIDAINAMYSAVGWGWATRFMKWPIWAGLFDRGYLWFARNRLRLTGRQCEEGNCKIPDS